MRLLARTRIKRTLALSGLLALGLAVGSLRQAYPVAEAPEPAPNPYFAVPETWQSFTEFEEPGSVKTVVLGPQDFSPEEDSAPVGAALSGPEDEEFVSATEYEKRPVIILTELGEVNDESLLASLVGDEPDYQRGRDEYLESIDGELVEFLPTENEVWPSGAIVRGYGYRYRLDEAEFTERSRFVNCRGKVYLIQSLISDSKRDEYDGESEEIIRSFRCG